MSKAVAKRELRSSTERDHNSSIDETIDGVADNTQSPILQKKTTKSAIIPTDQTKTCLVKDIQGTYNSNSLVVDVNLFANLIQASIAFLVLATFLLDIFLYAFQAKFSVTKKQHSWLYSKVFTAKPEVQTRHVSQWYWLLMTSSLVGINMVTLMLVRFDMRQLVNSGCRVSKNLLFLMFWCGGWLASPALYFTEYLRLNDFNRKKFAYFIVKTGTINLGIVTVLLVVCDFLIH